MLRDHRLRRVAASLIVCFDHIVEVGDENDPYMQGTRITRQGMRLLERKALLDNFRVLLRAEIEGFEMGGGLENPFIHEEPIVKWFHQNVTQDANNALLLRLDEWAVCAELSAEEVTMFATGERGSVPQEHRNTPAAWAAQKVKPDAQYRRIMLSSKANEKHAENIYVCFSAMLEQHFGFDWMTRCFVAMLNPPVALKKIQEYRASAHTKTPPIVVQLPEGRAVLVSNHGRMYCENPASALSAWITHVEVHSKGEYTRKANISGVLERLNRTTNVDSQIPNEICGAGIQIIEEEGLRGSTKACGLKPLRGSAP
jgi:hypothetical protein